MVAAGAAVAAAIANAIKASGVVVRVESSDFRAIIQRVENPLVVHATTGRFSTKYLYLTSYKGLAFFTKSTEPLQLAFGTELIMAQSIWIPG